MNKIQVTRKAPLLQFLFESLPDMKKTRVRQLLKFRSVHVNGKPVTQFNHELRPGDRVEIRAEKKKEAVEPGYGLKIIFEDAHIIVVDKPAGLLSIATEKIARRDALYAVNAYVNGARVEREDGPPPSFRKQVFVVHRLDRDASGLLLFAKNFDVKKTLQTNWESFEKKYYAVVEGVPQKPSGEIRNWLKENKALKVASGPKRPDSKLAVTEYRVAKPGKERSLLEITIKTGRKHQIRVHCADMGTPIAGDKVYGGENVSKGRLALHAFELSIDHPRLRRRMTFRSPLPPELTRQLNAGPDVKRPKPA